MRLISNNEGKSFFIDGFGGCGKTYLYQALCHTLQAQHIIILCVASTGLACLLLPGGQTAHSMFKIPIDTLDSHSICNIPKQSLRADLLRMAKAVIYDECLMTHWHCFEALDRTLQDLRDSPKAFGGLTMIFGGDFQQILPVIPNGSRADIVEACIRQSYIWNNMTVLKLRINMRLQRSLDDIIFSQWLLDVGHGRNIDNDGNIIVPKSMLCSCEDDLIDKIYGDITSIHLSPSQPDYFLNHAILAARKIMLKKQTKKFSKKCQAL
jgi:ATP-dependent DNA helicase PIF1